VRFLDAVQSCKTSGESTKHNIVRRQLLRSTVPGPAKGEDQPPRPKHLSVVPMLYTAIQELEVCIQSAPHLTEAGGKTSSKLTSSTTSLFQWSPRTALKGSRGSNRLVSCGPWDFLRGTKREKMNPK